MSHDSERHEENYLRIEKQQRFTERFLNNEMKQIFSKRIEPHIFHESIIVEK